LGIVLIVLVFVYNVVATDIKAKKVTGIMAVLMVDLAPLFALYLIAFPAITNMPEDLYWWWWLVQLWVEATWEILIGCIMALALMQLLGTSRRIVETWLYIEVALVLGTGILAWGTTTSGSARRPAGLRSADSSPRWSRCPFWVWRCTPW
jgi:nitric oxide reductase subunit B